MIEEQSRRLQTVRTLFIRDHPFFAAGVLRANLVVLPPDNPRVPTFATDGKDIMVNAGFAASLKGRTLFTPFCEEVIHCYSGHLWRKPRWCDWHTWNLACDQEARWVMETENEKARRSGQAIPFPWPRKEDAPQPRFRGKAPEVVARILMEESGGPGGGNDRKNKQPHADSGGPGKSGGRAGRQQQDRFTPGKNARAGGGGKQAAGKGPTKQDAGASSSTAESTHGLADFTPPAKDDPGGARLQREWAATAIQAAAIAKTIGDLPGAFAKLAQKAIAPEEDPLARAREWLTEVGRNGWSFLRPNLRLRHACPQFLLPGRHSREAGVVVTVTDTSASITTEELRRFQGFKQWILDEWNPRLLVDIYADVAVQETIELEPGDTVPLKAKGGGGTNFGPAIHYAMEHYGEECRALIYITDLAGRFPDEPPFPVLWVVRPTKVRQPEPPYGETVRI